VRKLDEMCVAALSKHQSFWQLAQPGTAQNLHCAASSGECPSPQQGKVIVCLSAGIPPAQLMRNAHAAGGSTLSQPRLMEKDGLPSDHSVAYPESPDSKDHLQIIKD